MASTFATVIIPASAQEAAQADLPDHFGIGYYEAIEAVEAVPATDTEPAIEAVPAADPTVVTHYVDSGFWYDHELDTIVNETTWPKTVRFGDAQAALASLNLKPAVLPVPESPVTE